MYQIIQHGGRLDSEFFPESLVRRTWPTAPEYCRFLRSRAVDRVIVYYDYDVRLGKNEQKLLRLLSSTERDACRSVGVAVRHISHFHSFDVYAISR
jgi:hypothetical protein